MMFTEKQIGESCSYVFKMLNPEEDKKVLKSLFQFSINISGRGEAVRENMRGRFLERRVKYMSRYIYKTPRMKG